MEGQFPTRRGHPRPTDLSRHVHRLGGGALPAYAKTALAAIDAVRTDGGMPIIQFDEATILGRPQARIYLDQNIIEVDPARPALHFGLTHEIGHAIDYSLGGGRFASIDDARLAKWRRAAQNANGYLRILDFGGRAQFLDDAEMAAYAVRYSELWARSYAQYIAVRSGLPDLLRALRDRQGYDPDKLQLQWEDDDFAPITDAIDGYFTLLLWIV